MGNPLMEKMLGLPEFEVTDFKQNDNDMGFYVETKLRPSVCPACGCYKPELVIYKSREQTVRDISALGKRSALIINRRYYECRECGGRFAEPLTSVGEGERITKRLRFFLSMAAASVPFVDLEREYQISDTTIRKAFLDRVNALPKPGELETPKVLGIDEICLMKDDYQRKQPWAIIANGDENTVMEVLRDRSKPSVIDFLQSMKDPKKVEVVTMDMWSGYRSAVYETLPKATVVIDKFHVVKMATEQMDSARKYYYKNAPYGLKKSKGVFLMREDKLSDKGKGYRDTWFEQYPKLKAAYDLKEAFFRIYDCKSRQEAEQAFHEWYMSIPLDRDFNGWRMIASTVRRRKREIFNYFDAPYTNAFVEGLNSVIRSISDEGRGYDFDILRGKVLLSAGRKVETPKTNFDVMAHFDRAYIKDYGVSFDDIHEAIKKGFFRV
jgi:transposase